MVISEVHPNHYSFIFQNLLDPIVISQPQSLDLSKYINEGSNDFGVDITTQSNFLVFRIPNVLKQVNFEVNSKCPFPITAFSVEPQISLSAIMNDRFDIRSDKLSFGFGRRGEALL